MTGQDRKVGNHGTSEESSEPQEQGVSQEVPAESQGLRIAAAWMDRLERHARRAADFLRQPRQVALVVSLLILAGVLIRLPAVTDEDAWFGNHADEATYFNQAYSLYLIDELDRTPLEHGGSGLPFLLEFTYEQKGIEPQNDPQTWYTESRVDQYHDHEAKPLDEGQRRATAIAYALNAMLGAGTVAAAWLLARQLLGALSSIGATAFVAADPFQVFVSAQLMTEAAYTLCIVLSLYFVFRARDHPAWILATAPLLAWAHFLRANGLVMMVAILGFAAIYLPYAHRKRHPPPKKKKKVKPKPFRWSYLVGAFLAFWLISAPYLEWRDEHLPSGFDYGTNSRFFADSYWNISDPYWQNGSYGDRGPKETMSDYFNEHSVGDAFDRVWTSFSWQVDDVFVGKAWHDGKRGHGDTVVLHPLLVGGLAVAGATAWRRRDLWFVPVAFAFSYIPVAWTYAIHDSPRYYGPVGVLVAVAAFVGFCWLAFRTRWPYTVAGALMALFSLVYAAGPLLEGVRVLPTLGAYGGVWSLVIVMTLIWLALATSRDWIAWWKGRA